MNANTALKINDAVDQAIRCGESVDATRAQFERALARAIEEHRPGSETVLSRDGGPLDGLAYAYALGIRQACRADYPETVDLTDVRVLHRGCANEAAWFSFTTSTGETYAVEVQRRETTRERYDRKTALHRAAKERVEA